MVEGAQLGGGGQNDPIIILCDSKTFARKGNRKVITYKWFKPLTTDQIMVEGA